MISKDIVETFKWGFGNRSSQPTDNLSINSNKIDNFGCYPNATHRIFFFNCVTPGVDIQIKIDLPIKPLKCFFSNAINFDVSFRDNAFFIFEFIAIFSGNIHFTQSVKYL